MTSVDPNDPPLSPVVDRVSAHKRRNKLFTGFAMAALALGAPGGVAYLRLKAGFSREGPVVCLKPVWDLGAVRQEKPKPMNHRFRLENVSNQTMRIAKVVADCGCVVAEKYPNEIAAGSAVDLAVSINPAGQPGTFRKHVSVIFETLPVSKLELGIQGTITASPALYLVPVKLDFGKLRPNEIRSRHVKVVRYDSTPVKFQEATPRSGALCINNAVSGDLDSFVELTVSLDSASVGAGEFSSTIDVATGNTGFPNVKIPVQARIDAPPRRFVESIIIDRLPRGEHRDEPLVVPGTAAAKVDELRYEGPGPITVSPVRASDAGTASGIRRIRVSRGEAGKPCLIQGTIVVKLSDRIAPARIPLTVYLPN